MIKTFSFTTKIESDEFHHNVYAIDEKTSIEKWLIKIEELKDFSYSFNSIIVEEIKFQIKNRLGDLFKIDNGFYIKYLLNGTPQITYIQELKKKEIDFIAKVFFLKSEDGGRTLAVQSGYRPQFEISGYKYSTSAEQLFVEQDKVFPGEIATSEVRILSPELFEGLLFIGMKFNLAEGRKKVASGEIISIVNQVLIKK